jgi:hypothetical protein
LDIDQRIKIKNNETPFNTYCDEFDFERLYSY